MLILNFSHPLTPGQRAQLESLTGQDIAEVYTLPVHFDNALPFLPQLEALMGGLPLSAETLQSEPVLVVLPALNFITALALAELHGRMGYFPPVARLRPVAGSLPPRYEVAEVLNLQAVREAARKGRFSI